MFLCLHLEAPEALCFRVVRPSVHPSVRLSKAWNTLFWPVHGSVGRSDQPWPFYGMSVRPSVRPTVRLSVRWPERFPGICRRTHGGNSLKFYMLMYLDHFQNWLVYGYSLLLFLIFTLFWLLSNLRFPDISRRTHGGNGLKFCTLMYLDLLQNCIVYGHDLLIF